MNPLLCTDYAKRRVVEEVMAIRGRVLDQPARTEYRHRLEAMTLEQATKHRDDLLQHAPHCASIQTHPCEPCTCGALGDASGECV